MCDSICDGSMKPQPILQIHCFITDMITPAFLSASSSMITGFSKVSELFFSAAKQNKTLKSQRSEPICIWHRRFISEDCRGHPLSGRQDLPCPVRLNLPPSQSAFELQLCFPFSCRKQKTEVSMSFLLWNVHVKQRGKQHNMWSKLYIQCSSLQLTLSPLWRIKPI